MADNLKKLVEKAMQGDDKALELLIKLKHKDILHMTAHFAANPQDIDDFAQEAVINVMNSLPKLRDPEKFDTWLVGVVRNTCLDRNRRMGIQNDRLAFTDFEEEEAIKFLKENRRDFLPLEYAEDVEKREIVMAEINAMPEHYRESLMMFYYHEMSYEEIAEFRNVSKKKVANDLLRARVKLKEQLERRLGDGHLLNITPVSLVTVLARMFGKDTASNSVTNLKVAAVTVATISVIVIGVIVPTSNKNPQPAQEETLAQETEAETEITVQMASTESAAEEIQTSQTPIITLSDMIGEEHESYLLSLNEGNVDESEWQAFIEAIGAEYRGSSMVQYMEEFTLYELHRQDKQLLLIIRRNLSSGELTAKYRFGITGPLPDMLDLILLFESDE